MSSQKHLLPLYFSPEAWARLQEIKDLIKAKDNAGTIREGLRILDSLVRQTNDGWKLKLVKENTVREFELDINTD